MELQVVLSFSARFRAYFNPGEAGFLQSNASWELSGVPESKRTILSRNDVVRPIPVNYGEDFIILRHLVTHYR